MRTSTRKQRVEITQLLSRNSDKNSFNSLSVNLPRSFQFTRTLQELKMSGVNFNEMFISHCLKIEREAAIVAAGNWHLILRRTNLYIVKYTFSTPNIDFLASFSEQKPWWIDGWDWENWLMEKRIRTREFCKVRLSCSTILPQAAIKTSINNI